MKEAAVAEGGANVGQEGIGSTGGLGFRKYDDNDNEVAVSCNLQYFLNILSIAFLLTSIFHFIRATAIGTSCQLFIISQETH